MSETEVVMVDLNYNFECNYYDFNYDCECDWLTELHDDNKLFKNQLPDDNLARELVANRRDFKPFTIEEIIYFFVISITKLLLVIGSPRDYFGAIRCFSILKHIQTTNGADALTLARDLNGSPSRSQGTKST